jgi:uncharacterized cupin superfamily protein
MIAPLNIPGGWMWSAWQSDRGMPFNSYLFEHDGGAVVIDPLPLDEESLAQIAARGGIHTIVLTNRDHRRGAAELRERFGARVVAHAAEAPLFDIPVDGVFSDGEEIFAGAFALAVSCGKTSGEVVIHLPWARAAIVGDALIGAPAGALSLLPDQKLRDPHGLLFELRRLWALDLQALLLCDGSPVFSGADALLGEFLETRGGAEINRINAADLTYESDERGAFASDDAEVGLLIGARKLGYRVSRIPPGKAFCPLHSHRAEEEFFYVIEGNPSVRTLRGTIECRPGDFIAFPTGERGTHQLRNDSGSPALVLLVGMSVADEVCLYPDSEKVLVDLPGRESLMLRSSPVLDYYDGE